MLGIPNAISICCEAGAKRRPGGAAAVRQQHGFVRLPVSGISARLPYKGLVKACSLILYLSLAEASATFIA